MSERQSTRASDADTSHPLSTTTLLLALITLLGLALRIASSRAQEPIVDELFSLVGARAVAGRGVPLLPSGVLYLHGTLQSYLLAPLVLLGFGHPDDLWVLRLLSAVAGAVAIVLAFRLARFAGAAPATSLFAAALVAIDPASVLWSGYVRMYAFAQPLAIAVALLFLQAISPDERDARMGSPRRRMLISLVVVFWLAVFTHLATALLWPAMAVVAVVVYGWSLLHKHRDLTLSLAACALAPLLLIGLTGAIGPGAGTRISGRAEGLPGVSFLGEENVNLAQILHPDPAPWTSLFVGGPLALLMPLLLALASGVLVGRFLTTSPLTQDRGHVRSIGALLALYWLPILALAMFATNAAERYAVFLLPSGYVLLALAVQVLVEPQWRVSAPPWAALGGALLALAIVAQGVTGSAALIRVEARQAQAGATAEEYVAEHRQPGELILTTSAVDTALTMGELPELRFLPGGEGSQRTLRYTRFTSDGQAIDYWIGMPSLNTTQALCTTLRDSPGSWILVIDRIWENWGYNDLSVRQMERKANAMRELINGVAEKAYEDGKQLVFRSRPAADWSAGAQRLCNGNGG